MKTYFFSNTAQWRNTQRKQRFFLCLLFFTLFTLCLTVVSLAQTPVQVVTKVITKDLPYADGQRIRVNAQKADVTLTGWNRPTISVKLRLVAKHPDRDVAEREVAYHQYTLQASNGQIDLSNRFEVPKGSGKLQSQLKAIYDVSVPEKALITLVNSFGDVRLTNLSGEVGVTLEFGKLSLDDIGGKLTIASTYGDIDGRNVDATLVCKAEKADILLRDLGGKVNLQSRYGKLTLLPAATLDGLTVEAARTEIVLSPLRIDAFQYDLQTAFGELRVPAGYTEFLGSYGSRKTFDYPSSGKKPVISIQNSYHSIVVQPGSAIGTVSR